MLIQYRFYQLRQLQQNEMLILIRQAYSQKYQAIQQCCSGLRRKSYRNKIALLKLTVGGLAILIRRQ